jgi:hypothetical protein
MAFRVHGLGEHDQGRALPRMQRAGGHPPERGTRVTEQVRSGGVRIDDPIRGRIQDQHRLATFLEGEAEFRKESGIVSHQAMIARDLVVNVT